MPITDSKTVKVFTTLFSLLPVLCTKTRSLYCHARIRFSRLSIGYASR